MEESKETLLFIDEVCPRAYGPSNIDQPGCGGTEQTVVTLAEALSEHFNVVVEQHNRLEMETYCAKATYTSKDSTRSAKYVVCLRHPRALLTGRERFRDAKLYLFSHDLADRNLGRCVEAGMFKDSGCLTNIVVSQWHRTQTIEVIKQFGYTGQFKIRAIYNPLSEDVIRTGEPYDKNKLIWLASPHKGLDRAYEIFRHLLNLNSDFRLYVTNPGYLEDQYAQNENVKEKTIVLGTLPHFEAMRSLGNALCLFYPNTVFPETFGKIMAEANAVGTPVLTHAIGAAREVLDSHPDQIVDCRDDGAVVKRVMKWYSGARPIVRGKPEFKLSRVVQEWVRLLKDVR